MERLRAPNHLLSPDSQEHKMTGKSVGIVGAGPAGAMAAYLLARAGVSVDLYDFRNTTSSVKPVNCSGCAGIVQQDTINILRDVGLTMPLEVVQCQPLGQILHLPEITDTIELNLPMETLFRGTAPTNQPSTDHLNWSFDGWLLNQAKSVGATFYNVKVRKIQIMNDQGQEKPHIMSSSGDHHYDLVINASGHSLLMEDTLRLMRYCEKGIVEYKPKKARAGVREYYFGQEKVTELLNNHVHFFGNPSKKILAVAVVPKGNYITVAVMGRGDVSDDDLTTFLASKGMIELVGENLTLREKPNCQCSPFITLQSPTKYMISDRAENSRVLVVNVGDSGATRPRKNGLYAALDNTAHLVAALLSSGISTKALADYKEYIDDTYVKDNRWVEIMMKLSDIVMTHQTFQFAVFYAIKYRVPLISKLFISIIDHMLTGRRSYHQIPFEVMRTLFE